MNSEYPFYQIRFANAHNLTNRQRKIIIDMLATQADGKIFTGIAGIHSGAISAYIPAPSYHAYALALDIERLVPCKAEITGTN